MKKSTKIKRKLKKNPTLLPILIIIVLIVAILCISFVPSIIQYITNEGDGGDSGDILDNPWYIYDYSSYVTNYVQEEFEDVIYCHSDGDNTTGGYDWEHAYTDLPSAIAYAQGTPYWTTLILMGAGTWDVLQPEAQIIDRNIILVGAGRDVTIIRNTHPIARSVFLVQDLFRGYRFSVELEDTCDGIIVEENIIGGDYEPDVNLYDINFITNVTTILSPQGLALGTSHTGEFKKLNFFGLSHGTITAINISNSWNNMFEDINIFDLQVGILIEINASDNNIFRDIEIYNATLGIDIDAGNNQHFHHITFEEVLTAIDDEVGDSYWNNAHTDWELSAVSPDNLVGIDVDTNVAANVYGVDTMIFDAIAIDIPFYLIAIIFEPDAQERYEIRLWNDGIYFFQTVVEGTIDQLNRLEILNPIIFNAHSRIYCSIRSETGGDDMDIWVELIAI